jgi:uncharacterized protein YfaS (alpha-2-macroglobulin family)
MGNLKSSSRRPNVFWLVFTLLIGISLACSFPVISQNTPTPPTSTAVQIETGTPTPLPTATATPHPLPPGLVEADPASGSEIPLNGTITLYFNQPMDQQSVGAALAGEPGSIEWKDEATLTFSPREPLAPASQISLRLDASAKAANGLALSKPIELSYQTAGYLRLIERLPQPGTEQIDPTSAILATFNLPVVPLGAEPDSLPPGFNLTPAAKGQGEWLNTSTYAFYPQPALAGGMNYTVRLNPDLQSADGSPLKNVESWSFGTVAPSLVSIQPAPDSSGLSLDTHVVLTFNQPMDPDKVESNFALLDANAQVVAGELSWNDDHTQATFSPRNLLKRGHAYHVELNAQAQSSGGTTLGQAVQAAFRTVQPLRVDSTEPFQGGNRNVFAGVAVHFNAPISSRDILQFITFSPEVSNLNAFADEDGHVLRLFGDFAPETDYTLILSPNLPDAWNGRLGDEFTLHFHTLPLDPNIVVTVGSDVLFLSPSDSNLNAQITNLPEVSLSLGSLSVDDFIALEAPGNYNQRQDYQSSDQREYQYTLSIQTNRSQAVDIPLSLGSGPLSPGLYYVRFNTESDNIFAGPYLVVVSNVQLTFKLGATDALVWAVDMRDGEPLEDSQVTLYAEDGSVLAKGRTDEDGILKTSIPTLKDVYSSSYAVLGQPGDETFALALSTWDQGIEAWNYQIAANYAAPHLEAYLYTDRPIYQPGQTVYFRAIARQAYNGRYTLPDRGSLPITLFNDVGEKVTSFDLPLSAFGTAHASYTLPAETAPGYYSLTSEEANFSTVSFQVAEYRKPDIDLSVSFDDSQSSAGKNMGATIEARYFFDAPAANISLQWQLFKERSSFSLPGYQVGTQDASWLRPFPAPNSFFGEMVSEGNAKTDASGKATLEFATAQSDTRQRYTLEVTAQDESGQPVSARSSIQVNPAEFYIGVRPDTWVGQAGSASGFEVLVVDWDGDPDGSRALRAEFQKVVWERVDPEPGDPFAFPEFVPEYTPIGSTDFVTSNEGLARLAFTPPEAGTYQLDVHGLHPGELGARTQVILWVSGAGQAIWPNLPNQRLRLTADQDGYQPGQTAQVFIPNPFEGDALALVTIERDVILRYQVLTIEGAGKNLDVPLGAEDAPNVYISVTLLEDEAKGIPDFRQGYIDLPVEPADQTLNVTLTSQPDRTGPGGKVSFGVRVTDARGNPAVGEFSLSVVDKAVLALAEPNAPDILPAFYGDQPLGVRTGLALAAYTRRQSIAPVGGGGGGGEPVPPPAVRQKFLDTAFWSAEIVTNENGEAQVSVTLPDNLTTWQTDLRGVTADTRVGQAEAQVVTTKDLIVSPVAPRFLVQGDHALLAAVVYNNTDMPLSAEVSLQASGFDLDEDSPAAQQVNVPANGRARVEWWGTGQNVESADPVFTVQAGDLEDSARPAINPLPVLSYSAPQTFGTSGTLGEGGERLELVSLPRSFEPNGGDLSVELAPSLGAAMLDALTALESYPCACTELALSRFLPNLETYRVVQDFGLEAPSLQARLNRNLEQGLAQLRAGQNEDGGWGWWSGSQSNAYITAYVLFGLNRAQEAGVTVPPEILQTATDYLVASLPTPEMLTETWQFDRLAFEQFVLSQVGSPDSAGVTAIYEERERLNPWAQALLALSIESLSPGDERAKSILSNLEANAIRTDTGAHWEDQTPDWQNMSTPIYASAVVLYALAQQDPASPLVADSVRYLMAHRGASGGWASSYETAWTLMALARVMQGTGELGGDFDFDVVLNGTPLASGQAGGPNQLNPVEARVPVSDLHPKAPNALVIERSSGPGRLYYTAHLNVDRPVASIPAIENGITVTRAYYPSSPTCRSGGNCAPIHSAKAGDLVDVRVTVTVPDSAYYLLVQDYLPAGSEVLDTSLKTSQQGAADYDPRNPFRDGWGWWYFGRPQIRDESIAWAADSLPAGTYQLTYTLAILQPGEYRVLPARAWQFYFPEVQGSSPGEVFRIEE